MSSNDSVSRDEALQLVGSVTVPLEQFFGWIAAAGAIPSHFAARLYLDMSALLDAAAEKAAADHFSREHRAHAKPDDR